MSVKRIVFFLLTLSGCFHLSAQEAKDVVLVVDTSAGMFSYYNEVNTYLTGPFLAENLKIGDTLHIISFASKPRFEIARRLLGKGDIETVSSRIWLLYPLENNTGSADTSLNYAEQYVRFIPGGRGKKVFVVSDNEGVGRLTEAVAGRLKPNGIDVIFIRASDRMGMGSRTGNNTPSRVPQASVAIPAGTAASGGNNVSNNTVRNVITGNVATGDNTGTVPGSTGGAAAGGNNVIGNNTVRNVIAGNVAAGDNTGTVPGSTGGAAAGGNNVIGNNTAGISVTSSGAVTDSGSSEQTAENNVIGGQNDSGSTELPQNWNIPNNSEIQPVAVTNTATAHSGASDVSALHLPLLFGLFLLLLLLLIIILVIRKHGFPSNKRAAFPNIKADGTATRNAELLNGFADRQAEASHRRLPHRNQYRDPGRFPTDPPMLNLFVEEQNTAIGKRNIHTLKKGNTYSVGGGTSDFLIFLIPVPPKVAALYFDGNNCTFTPLKPKYFPDLGSTPVNECIGKTIRLLSDKNYEVFFHFERYMDPLIALNLLMHSIQTPEEPREKKIHA